MTSRQPGFAQRLFDPAARAGAALIASMLDPLAADMVRCAAPQPGDRVLDVGTGIGPVARHMAALGAWVVGLDVSRESLRVAREHAPGLTWVQGDIERAPLASGVFTLGVAHLGLNLTDPRRSLRALRRLIAPGGRLVVQEWGPAAAPLLALDGVLAAYVTDSPGEALAALRAAVEDFPAPWTARIQDADDLREWLEWAGFRAVVAEEIAPVTLRAPSAEAWVAFALAETVRAAEVAALPDSARAACLADLHACARQWAGPDGSVEWAPVVLRARAWV